MTDLDKYIEANSTAEDPLLVELNRQTHLKVVQPRMISGHQQGKILEMIVRMLRPKQILEIGTFTGYSALCMASGLEDGAQLHTIEVDDELEDLAADFFARSPHGNKIVQHVGSALDIAPKIGECFDLIFMDGDKREYPQYYNMIMDTPLVRSGSYILADNVLWYGKVTQAVQHNDKHTQGIIDFNTMVKNDTRVENVFLPLRDGINLIRVL